MPDFIIAFDDPNRIDTAKIEGTLQNRPGVEDLPVRSWKFPWGTASVQQPRCFGYEPLEWQGELYFSVGRPRVMGELHEDRGPSGFMEYISKLVRSDAPQNDYCKLTGMFVLVACTENGITLYTDRLGLYAVYSARAKFGNRRTVGTNSELVAEISGLSQDYDLVSLGEALSRRTITFPYTTRNGMVELEPGSQHQFTFINGHEAKIQSRRLWVPSEPSRWPSLTESQDQLVNALRFSGSDITQGCSKVAATLSGGTDSRIVLACIPEDKRALAITFADHENNENRIAAQIAIAAGAPHYLAMRSPHFYAHNPEVESKLLGLERSPGLCHGYTLKQCMPGTSFDLLLCGDRSDTLLKGLYTNNTIPLIRYSRGNPFTYVNSFNYPKTFNRRGVAEAVNLLKPYIASSIISRMRNRLEQLVEIRPTSAHEWFCLYPLSRHEDISYAQSNARFFKYDLPFMHSRVIDVCISAQAKHKCSRQLSTHAFNVIGENVNRVMNANNGLPANASVTLQRARYAQNVLSRIINRSKQSSLSANKEFPWYTEDSWIDHRVLQKKSSHWLSLQQIALSNSKVFPDIFKESAKSIIERNSDNLSWNFYATIVNFINHSMGHATSC